MGLRDPLPMIDGAAYREAMARLAGAVHLVTTDGPGGRAGFTATAVCSVSDTPPTLLVCINRGASAFPAFDRNGRLCVNLLAADQRAIADVFGRRPMEERFRAGAWDEGRGGGPLLAGALAAFECRIVRRVPAGTHDVLFCEVDALAGGGGDALVYGFRRYHALAAEEAPAEPPRLDRALRAPSHALL
ncbi:flavin reductase [Methylobacterium komagatae]